MSGPPTLYDSEGIPITASCVCALYYKDNDLGFSILSGRFSAAIVTELTECAGAMKRQKRGNFYAEI